MKKTIILTAFSLLLTAIGYEANAQYYFYDASSYNTPIMFELGASAGVMNCLTDVGGNKGLGKPFLKDLNFGNTMSNGTVYLSATYKEAVALRVEGTFGKLQSYDSILKEVKATSQGRYQRNLNFQTKISEISFVAEFHPLFMFIDWSLRDDQDPPLFSPYLLAGVGFYSFNPQSKNRDGQLVDLQPLSTEGQGFARYPERKPYKLSQMNIPVGIGLRYELSPTFNLRAELVHRTLFTDYLDDVSTRYPYNVDAANNVWVENGFRNTQLRDALDLSSNQRTNDDPIIYRKGEGGIRGNPKNNDSYFTFNIKLGLTFGRERMR